MGQPLSTPEADERRAAQVKEYGTYRAVAPIDIDGVRAFNVGDPVPVGHVDTFGYGADQVERVEQDKPTPKAARAANTEGK